MEEIKFDMQMADRLYSFFLDILSNQKDQVKNEEDKGSIWEFWEKEL